MGESNKSTKRVVVVGDDFGVTSGVNEGMVRCYKEGFLTELSLMVDAPKTKEAVLLSEDLNIKEVGLHQILFPWSPDRRYNRQDYIDLFEKASESEIQEIVTREFKVFEDMVGRKPSHLTAQYGIHGNLKVLEVVLDYAKNADIPVRLPLTALRNADVDPGNYAAEVTIRRSGVRMANYLFSHVLGNDSTEIRSAFLKELDSVREGESCELLFHPGYLDRELLGITSLGFERTRDLAILLDREFRQEIVSRGFDIVNYSKI